MSPFTLEIIRSVLPEKLDNWKANECHSNIIGSLGVLACQIGEENPDLCTENLKVVLSYITKPLLHNIEYIKTEQGKLDRRIVEDDVNMYVFTYTCEQLELLSEFVKSCQALIREPDSPSPFTPIFTELWPFILSLLQDFGHIDKLAEQACRLVKHCIRIIPGVFHQYMVPFLQIVIQQFDQCPCSAFIYSIEFCMKEYQSYPQFDVIFKEAFDMMVSKCARMFATKKQLSDNPSIADDFFSICKRFMAKKKEIFFGS
jgi:hypothetical protein